MVSAERVESSFPGWEFFNNAEASDSGKFNLDRFITALKFQFRINEYRANQALTFAKMTQIHLMLKLHLKD
jgi:hypothetical protein